MHGEEVVARLRVLAADAKAGVAEAVLAHRWLQHLPLTEYFDLLPAQRAFACRPELEKALDLTAEYADEALAWCVTALEAPQVPDLYHAVGEVYPPHRLSWP